MASLEYNSAQVMLQSGVEEAQVVNLILVGSRLHGTASPTSDYDFIMVVEDGTHLPYGSKVEKDNLDVTIFGGSEYKAKIEEGNDWQTLEPLWVPESFRWIFKEDFLQYYKRDLANLRVAVSTISAKGHSYAKILMTKESNFYLAKKNIAHGIRNLRLGIQIIEHGGIIDYTESKDLFEQITAETSEDWNYYHEKWGSLAMQHQKEFVAMTPAKVKPPRAPRKRNRGTKESENNFEK